MIQRPRLLADLKSQVRDLEQDLRGRFASDAGYQALLSADWQAARDAGRTAEALDTWVEAQFTQSAVTWVLACVFVRFCEDNGLLDAPLIAGTDHQGRSAVARQEGFYREHPIASDNDYLREVFALAGRLPGLADVLKVQRSLLAAPVSADMARQLVRFFRATDADSGTLVHDFIDPDWNTRFLGDLYQDLSAAARERYALLQTPEFVEAFILDRTLTPALDGYPLAEVDLLDPTCGSGHFLLGAFDRLAPRWLRQHPDNLNIAVQEALNRIAGIDLNPFAVAIARFRLLVAALKLAQVRKLRLAPDFHLRIATGDSLLHGFDQRDYRRAQTALGLKHSQENLSLGGDQLYRHAFAAEDLEATNAILSRKYAAVVGNPPYITVKDRAVSALYRMRYESCSGKYALVSPFCERFWALAKPEDQAQRAGFVGLIVANSFMKREFGKKLVEGIFPAIDLTHVIDTSGAYIPGHGTPTAILFGRNRRPASPVVRTVMGISGEPSTPADPAAGLVWSAILNQTDHRGSESEWVSVADVERERFSKHPWSMGGGGASELKELVEAAAAKSLADLGADIGRTTHTGEDEVFYMPANNRWRAHMVPVVQGENVRDFSIHPTNFTIFPYEPITAEPWRKIPPTLMAHYWTYRTTLKVRKDFGQTPEQRGLQWFEHSMFFPERWKAKNVIALAEVTTHNHFVLDHGGKVFKQTAPIIKLPASATVDDHLGLLGLLNSSIACFWLKQVCFPKGGDHMGTEGARVRRSHWDERFAYDGTKVGQFPVAAERPVDLARRLDGLARERATWLPAALFSRGLPSRAELDAARREAERLRHLMIAWQEELDWRVYRIYGVLDESLCCACEPPPLRFGERAFEILLARQCAAGTTSTTWFERHGPRPVTELPGHWPADYRALVERRMAAIQHSRDLALIERPECKRRWAGTPWETLERAALEGWLLDRLEAADLWPREDQAAPSLRSARELVDALSGDEDFRRALDLYAGSGSDAHNTLVALVRQASVPFLDALRYSDSGLRKRAVWRETWALQRREDAIDAGVAGQMAGQPDAAIQAEQARRKATEVGAIPVPPKYRQEDFRDGAYWKLRGALDVPKERFVSFPGLERGTDAASPLLLWAGYDAKARALALAGYLYELLHREGADANRLVPALAGLDECLPWVHQWHPEVDEDLGMSTGDYLQGLLDVLLAQQGLTLAAVRAWRPAAPARRPRGRGARG
jgi:hypothetical protein